MITIATNIIISIYFKMDRKRLQIIRRRAHVVQKKKIYIHRKYQ